MHDNYQEVVLWMSKCCAASSDIEIECRFGTFKQQSTGGQRYGLPIKCLTVLETNNIADPVTFDSGVSQHVFAHMNEVLNNYFTNSRHDREKRGRDNQTPSPYPVIGYRHTKEMDKFYHIEEQGDFRETLDIKADGKVVATVQKERVGVLNFMSPQTKYDFRLTGAIEKPVPPLDPQPCDFIRVKDRISYSFDAFRVDLTKVEKWDNPDDEQIKSVLQSDNRFSPTKTTYELEIEITDVKYMTHERGLFVDKKPSSFYAFACKFFDHAVHMSHTLTSTSMPSLCNRKRHIKSPRSGEMKRQRTR